ncbi:PREDICTED: bifunctional lysine-specific demethylase and histidyl-hydroxylase NO66 [Papilio polytes]|uniref:bifunctional lysine-specific demethylase and histidyl-hydroxylase NO66 n=1 Tax=Papilio polytes TaxID=76194 RepID=UPI000676757E|nr:PREDICTED: bifunctional lysine-specific demethylase and histidyl-hydroxylase NO66 [Papilio polytes]
MDSPVSAFAMYKNTKQSTPRHDKKKKKRKVNDSNSQKALSRVLHDNGKNVAQKIKNKQKKTKETKNIIKKKTHKKKKLKSNKSKIVKNVDNSLKKSGGNDEIDEEASDSEEVPALIPAPASAPKNGVNTSSHEEDVYSHSSYGDEEITPVLTDSADEALKVFKWMTAPYSYIDFFRCVWERKPLHIVRNKPKYYNDLISTPLIDNMLRTENIQYTKNIDITSYVDGKRETHNPVGRALPHTVWDFYLQGCSIRLLNPQTYMSKLHLLNATLQEHFVSFVGANAYLTPPDSQGFAPHYDDIEAFILQAEGKKHWRIYRPLHKTESLPRVSSKNFSEEEIGHPVMEVTLQAGDMLYFPRGFIHQGVTIDGEHSLHVTISMYQKQSWADLFERMLPAALEVAINEESVFRQGLPFDIYENFGLVYSDVTTPRRVEMEEYMKNLFHKVKSYLSMDGAVDQICKRFQHDALPPVLSDAEKACTVYADTDVMAENGKVINRVEMNLDTKVRLLRKNILRMVSEDTIKIYYYTENSLEYHGHELSFLEIDEELAPAVETLITTYPEYVSIENLDVPNESDKMQIVDALWARGLLMTEYPLDVVFD